MKRILFVMLLLCVASAQAIITTEPTAYYRMNSSATHDWTGNYDATNSGVSIDGVNFKFGGGSGDYGGTDFQTVPLSAGGYDLMTVCDYVETSNNNQMMIAEHSANTAGNRTFYVYNTAGGVVEFQVWVGNTAYTATSITSVSTGSFTSWCARKNSTHIAIFVDGNEEDSTAVTGNLDAGNNILIGKRRLAAAPLPFTGNQDEVGIWLGSALTDAQILEYNNTNLYFGSGNFTITAIDNITGASINTFSVEVEGNANYSTTGGTVTTNITQNATAQYDLLFSGANVSGRPYFNRTFLSVNATTFEGDLFPYTRVQAYDALNSTLIDNFNLSYGSSEQSTTNGTIWAPFFNATYEATIDNVTHAGVGYTSETANITASPALRGYNFTLYPNPSNINISIYDLSTSALITDNVTMDAISNSTVTSASTTTGLLYLDNLTADTYTFTFTSENYTTKSYVVTIGPFSHQTLNVYLSNSTSTVSFTTKDQGNGETIEGALYTMQAVVEDSWTTIGSKLSDVTGGAQFSHDADEAYRFIVSKTGYQTKTFDLNPITEASYTIWLNPTSTYNYSAPLSGVTVDYYVNPSYMENGVTIVPGRWKNEATNNFTFMISAPSGNLQSYSFDLAAPGDTDSASGTNAYGSSLTANLSITGADLLDTVNLTYSYTLSDGTSHTLRNTFPIDNVNATGRWTDLDNTHFGLGVFERVLIVVLIAAMMAGIIGLLAGPLAGGAIALFIYGFFVTTGFLEIWFVVLPMIFIVFWILARSG